MHESHFEQLLRAAAAQPQPQRLLFVFAAAELPHDATPAQRKRFDAGEGGALTPLMCVDKAPSELTSFADLAAESRKAGPPWKVVFAAALSGEDGRPPTQAQIEAGLKSMVDAIHGGGVGRFLAFDASGEPVQFS